MKTDSLGRIIEDNGIGWSRSGDIYYSFDPGGYIIERTTTYPLWRLSKKSPQSWQADQIIFFSWRVIDCMRAAEIFDVTKTIYRNTGFIRS